jgi:spore coat protein U-like protein
LPKILAALTLLALSAAALPTLGGTATTSVGTSTTVTAECTITTTALNFGNYDPVVVHAAAALDGTGTVTIICTKGAAATVALGSGQNAGRAAGTSRAMVSAGEYLGYELFQDSGRSLIWGSAGSGVLAPPAAPSKAARTFTVYGRIPGGQDVAAGTYRDTVIATVNY